MLTEHAARRSCGFFFNRQGVFAAPLAVAAAVAITVVPGDLEDGPNGSQLAQRLARGCIASALLFNRYVFPFELVSLVLLAAMIGAIVLARREEERP